MVAMVSSMPPTSRSSTDSMKEVRESVMSEGNSKEYVVLYEVGSVHEPRERREGEGRDDKEEKGLVRDMLRSRCSPTIWTKVVSVKREDTIEESAEAEVKLRKPEVVERISAIRVGGERASEASRCCQE